MKFSICIPNYNYERYLGRTIQSVLDQTFQDFEIVVADNASTDGSVALVERFGDPRIRVHVNACNVGFAGNLDRAARMAQGEWMIMLSSDDLMRPDALATYSAILGALGPEADRTMISSTWDVIDPDDKITGVNGPNPVLWWPSDRDASLDSVAGGAVYRVAGEELLRRSLKSMINPFNFAATCYPRRLYEAVEGYGGNRMYNPDKWFHWRVLAHVERACFIDRNLFAYRWHPSNQVSQETATSALKLLVDEYVSTLELDGKLLERVGMSRETIVQNFVEYKIARHGLATLARGQRLKAWRILKFGQAVYPDVVRRNKRAWQLRTLLALGPLGQRIAHKAYNSYRSKGADVSTSRPPGGPGVE